jgi:exopolyphosphatase/pppGpp-phosphohydrolase
LAWQQAAGDTLALMARLQAETRVAVLVMPQSVEGAYAYASARQVLGARLSTSHVLDIGGGSLQIAGARSTYGLALGQKSWHQLLCTTLRQSALATCELQPMTAADLQTARLLLDEKFSGMAASLGPLTTLTAISRPVTRAVAPAVRLLTEGKTESPDPLSAQDISTAISTMAGLSGDKTATLVAAPANYVTYLLSDMLLLEGLLRATGSAHIQVIEGTLSILPALLSDDKAFQWSARYGCYLERFKASGPDAYLSDPATCLLR